MLIPCFIAAAFTFGTVGLLFASLAKFKSINQGLLAGIILLGTQAFIVNGSTQYTDVPVGFFFLAVIVLFVFSDIEETNENLLFLSGIGAGFAAWTKNEGLLFVVSIFIARIITVFFLKAGKKHLKNLLYFVYGLLPVLIMVIYYKIQLAPPNDLFSYQSFSLFCRELTDISRYFKIFQEFVNQTLILGKGTIALNLLVIYLLLTGVKINKERKLGVITSLITLLLLTTGYFFVYVITPNDLSWQLNTSLSRILVQIWPSIIFITFIIADPHIELTDKA